MDQYQISIPARRAKGERGAPLRVPLLQKGNPVNRLDNLEEKRIQQYKLRSYVSLAF